VLREGVAVKAPVKTPPSVPAVTLKASARAPASQAKLMERAAERAQSLLATSARVLVVYGEDGARLYCEPAEASAEQAEAPPSPAAHGSFEAELDEPPSASAKRKR
jgi:hypothetical protein